MGFFLRLQCWILRLLQRVFSISVNNTASQDHIAAVVVK